MSVSYGGDSITFADGSIVASGSQGFKNKIINGAMMIDQRNAGASLTITTNAQYSLDRWKSYMTQASKFSVRQMESSNTAASNYESSSAPTGFTNSIKVTSASAYSVLTGDYFTIGQNIEGYNIADLDWGKATAKTVTLSFWVKSSLIGTFGAALGNNAGNRGYPFSYTINVANTWEYKTVTITGDTTGTWETGFYNGIVLYISLGTGATYSGTAGAWTGSFLTSATGATSVVGTSGATFYLSGVQLEKGTTASSFEFRSYQKELILCQRYYQRMPITGTYSLEAYQGATGYVRSMLAYTPLPVVMRATPNRVVITTGNFTNIRGSSTTYAGLAPQSPSHCSAFLETNNATGMSGYTGAVDAMDAEM
jgi:hypothetical protein